MITCVTALAEGYDMSSIGGAIILMQKDFRLTAYEEGLVVSVLYLAMAFGAPFGGMLADILGRKPVLALTYVLLLCGSLCMSLATSFAQLLIGRCLLGVGIGAGLTVVTSYVAEVSPRDHRGLFVCMEDPLIVIGITLGYLSSALLAGRPNDWRWVLGVGAVPVSVALILVLLPQLPESPRWNMLTGNYAQARLDLSGLVGEEEAELMMQQWGGQGLEESSSSWASVLCPSGYWRRRALLAGCGVLVANACTGISVITPYLSNIINTDFPEEPAFYVSVGIGSLRVVTALGSIFFLLNRVGRKPLILLSLGGCSVALVGLSLAYSFRADVWVKILALTVYCCFYAAGIGPVTFVYCSEVFPTDVRSRSFGLGLFVQRLVSGFLVFSFPFIGKSMGLGFAFLLLAAAPVASLFFVGLCIPESAGNSLEEMRCIFKDPGEPLTAKTRLSP